MKNFIENHYLILGMLGLLGVFFFIILHGFTGDKGFLQKSQKQYIAVILMVISTPLILWLLKG